LKHCCSKNLFYKQQHMNWRKYQIEGGNVIRGLSYLKATRYFWPSFSSSAMTQSVMHGVPAFHAIQPLCMHCKGHSNKTKRWISLETLCVIHLQQNHPRPKLNSGIQSWHWRDRCDTYTWHTDNPSLPSPSPTAKHCR
jgi:hypothetical protein